VLSQKHRRLKNGASSSKQNGFAHAEKFTESFAQVVACGQSEGPNHWAGHLPLKCYHPSIENMRD